MADRLTPTWRDLSDAARTAGIHSLASVCAYRADEAARQVAQAAGFGSPTPKIDALDLTKKTAAPPPPAPTSEACRQEGHVWAENGECCSCGAVHPAVRDLRAERDAARKRYDDLADGFWRIVDGAKLRTCLPSSELDALQRIVARLESADARLQAIADADLSKWHPEVRSADDFMAWAKSIAREGTRDRLRAGDGTPTIEPQETPTDGR